MPLFDSYKNPKPREKFSNKGLLSHTYWNYMQDGGDSDVEEDLATLHRFDFYFEVINRSMSMANKKYFSEYSKQSRTSWMD